MTSTIPHLAGNYAPVHAELTVAELPVAGRAPPELTGWYLRNGPNPHAAASAHWFLGDGTVHGVRPGHAAAGDRRAAARVPFGFHGNWLPDLTPRRP